MVEISLFDIFPPPEPISGEAQALNPFDVLIFTPAGAIAKGGEKLTSSLASIISRFLGREGAILPTTKLATTVSSGGRFAGAPFRTAVVSDTRTSTANLISIPTKTTTQTTSRIINNPFSGRVNTNLAIGSTAALGTAGLLTLTPGGQQLTEKTTDVAQDVTKFFTENPLILAGIVVLGGILVLK